VGYPRFCGIEHFIRNAIFKFPIRAVREDEYDLFYEVWQNNSRDGRFRFRFDGSKNIRTFRLRLAGARTNVTFVGRNGRRVRGNSRRGPCHKARARKKTGTPPNETAVTVTGCTCFFTVLVRDERRDETNEIRACLRVRADEMQFLSEMVQPMGVSGLCRSKLNNSFMRKVIECSLFRRVNKCRNCTSRGRLSTKMLTWSSLLDTLKRVAWFTSPKSDRPVCVCV